MPSKIPMPLVAMLLFALSGCGGPAETVEQKGQPTLQSFSIGGLLSGLEGSVKIRVNGDATLELTANGDFALPTPLETGKTYQVSVETQPAGQACQVKNGAGTVGEAKIENILIACSDLAYSVGGMVSGLAAGSTLVLRNNGVDQLSISVNGAFHFAKTLAMADDFTAMIVTQPLNQLCTVTNGRGTIVSSNIVSVAVACTPRTVVLGGMLIGLAEGTSIILRNNGGNDLTLSQNGAFTFTGRVTQGGTYAVTVFTSPANALCQVTAGSGTAAAVPISSIVVTCGSPQMVGGTLSGLPAGASIVLTNNGGNNLTLSANGAFTFTSAIGQGTRYTVAIRTQPAAATGKLCAVSQGSGRAGTANITNVLVKCGTPRTITGEVSGLVAGTSVVLSLNGGANLTRNTNDAFTFAQAVPETASYSVQIVTQPTNRVCAVTAGMGTAGTTNVTAVRVRCGVPRSVSGTLSGLTTGAALAVRVSGGATVSLVANGSFTFPQRAGQGNAYAVTIVSQPANLACAVTNPTGTAGTTNITNVEIKCGARRTIGGTLTGLGTGKMIVLRNNGGNALTLSANAAFTFTLPVGQGNRYQVTVGTAPTGQTCTVNPSIATVVGTSNITSVAVRCTTP